MKLDTSDYSYDKDTGVLYRIKSRSNRAPVGPVQKTPHSGGGLRVGIGGKRYKQHRVIWYMVTGEWPETIDHINGDDTDNRWLNLRDTNQKTNMQNTKRRIDNVSGVVGVARHLHSGKWQAYFGTRKHLGLFTCFGAAVEARRAAAAHYHPNHGRSA